MLQSCPYTIIDIGLHKTYVGLCLLCPVYHPYWGDGNIAIPTVNFWGCTPIPHGWRLWVRHPTKPGPYRQGERSGGLETNPNNLLTTSTVAHNHATQIVPFVTSIRCWLCHSSFKYSEWWRHKLGHTLYSMMKSGLKTRKKYGNKRFFT